MTLTQLEYVLAIDEFRHFNKAAQSKNITQPTLSMQLQKLEDELGHILFDRSKNPIIPTEIGKQYITQARIVLHEAEKLKSFNLEVGGKTSGEYKLGIIPTIAPYLLPLFISQFTKKFPNIQLTVEELKTEDLIRKLENDQIDGGICATPVVGSNCIERVLYYEPFMVFFHENHKLLSKNKIKVEDLDQSEVWLLNEGHCFRNQALQLCQKIKSEKIPTPHFFYESGSLETLIRLVEKGSGYTFIPQMASFEMSKKRIANIREFNLPVPSREVSFITSRIFMNEKITNLLVEEIVSSIPSELISFKRAAVKILPVQD